MKTMVKHIVIAASILAAAFFFRGTLVDGAAQDSAAKGKNWKLVAEPVFGGEAWIYSGGDANESTVMLVHGVGDLASKIWEPFIPELEKTHRVITFDLPGFGDSSKEDGNYSPKNYARFLRFVAKKYEVKNLTVVGHSLGGAVSLFYAGTYPGELERLVIIDAAGILHRAAFVKGHLLISGKTKDNIFTQKPVSILNRWIESTLGGIDSEFMPDDLSVFVEEKVFRKGVLKNHPQKVAGMSLVSTDFSETLFAVKAPTAVIWGGKDDIAPVRTASVVASMLPETHLYMMPESGHSPMLDEPEKFRKALLKCIDMPAAGFHGPDDSVPKGGKNIDLIEADNAVLDGVYGTVYIDSCLNVSLDGVRAEKIVIKNSSVVMVNSVVRSAGVAVDAADSTVEMSGVMIYGDTAVRSEQSSFDCAGVILKGKTYAVEAVTKSKFLFSVSRLKSQYRNEFRHGMYALDAGDKL